MQHYSSSALTDLGKPAGGASITVKVAGTMTNASIFSDDGVTAKSNPFTANNLGQFDFYAASGKYDISIAGTQITTYTLTSQVLFDPFEQTVADTGMAVKSINAGSLAAAQLNLTGLTTSLPITTWFTPTQAGFYILYLYVQITTGGGSGNDSVSVTYTDNDNSAQITNSAFFPGISLGVGSATVVAYLKANAAVTYSTNLQSAGSVYNARLRALPLG